MINLFQPNVLLPYPVKTEENLWFLMFSGAEKGIIGRKWLKVQALLNYSLGVELFLKLR